MIIVGEVVEMMAVIGGVIIIVVKVAVVVDTIWRSVSRWGSGAAWSTTSWSKLTRKPAACHVY